MLGFINVWFMPTVLITGGTGFIGKEITALLLRKNYEVILLSRTVASPGILNKGNIGWAGWDIKKGIIYPEAIRRADYIIHLAGAGVAEKRWTKKRKEEIVSSRVQSSKLLLRCLQETKNNVRAVISASAIGWYGPDREEPPVIPFREMDPPDDSFLGETCRLWEESLEQLEGLNIRLVKMRTGIVLGPDGGALRELLKPLRFGIATILGSGKQVISWIHLEDLCRLYLEAMENEAFLGAFNAVAPKPVTNRNLVTCLAREVRGKFYIPVYIPSFLLKWIMGEMSVEILKSTSVSADKARNTGFQFLYPSVDAALKACLNR